VTTWLRIQSLTLAQRQTPQRAHFTPRGHPHGFQHQLGARGNGATAVRELTAKHHRHPDKIAQEKTRGRCTMEQSFAKPGAEPDFCACCSCGPIGRLCGSPSRINYELQISLPGSLFLDGCQSKNASQLTFKRRKPLITLRACTVPSMSCSGHFRPRPPRHLVHFEPGNLALTAKFSAFNSSYHLPWPSVLAPLPPSLLHR
jgi:hypothetical protein